MKNSTSFCWLSINFLFCSRSFCSLIFWSWARCSSSTCFREAAINWSRKQKRKKIFMKKNPRTRLNRDLSTGFVHWIKCKNWGSSRPEKGCLYRQQEMLIGATLYEKNLGRLFQWCKNYRPRPPQRHSIHEPNSIYNHIQNIPDIYSILANP